MKKQGVVRLTVFLVILAVMLYVSLFGVSFGVKEILPMATQLKQTKLGLDLTGGFSAVYEASSEGVEDFDSKMEGTISILQARLADKGMTEATVTRQGDSGIRVEIPSAAEDPSTISEYLSSPAKLEWKDADGNVVVEGEHITQAQAGNLNGKWVVSFTLDSEGTKAFGQATANNIGKQLGIYVDDELISNPTVNTAITGGSGVIEGNFTSETAQDLATQIESGALPLTLQEQEVRMISATLGYDALQKGIIAGIIGIAVIMICMIVVYRLPGLMSCIALLFYIVAMFFCILTMPKVQLTLPGIAGVLLSIGMAVDANVIIFERIKEELRAGKSMYTAMENGFQRAFSAILDSNVTTLIAAVVLMIFGAGSIQGFAYTLAIGIGCSMISAIFVTHFLLRQIVKIGMNDPKWMIKVK